MKKRIMALFLLSLLMIGSIGAVENSPNAAISDFFNNIKLGRNKEISENINNEYEKDVMEKIQKTVEWRFIKTEKNGDEAIAKIQTKAINFKVFMMKYFSENPQDLIYINSKQGEDGEIHKNIKDKINGFFKDKKNIVYDTNTLDVDLIKLEGKWEIKNPKEVIKQIFDI